MGGNEETIGGGIMAKDALKQYIRAEEHRYAAMQCKLAERYEKGIGVPRDEQKAVRLRQSAVKAEERFSHIAHAIAQSADQIGRG
jgi:TPR repeat protein